MKRAIIKRLIKARDGLKHRERIIAAGSKIALVVALAVFCGLGLGAPDARAAASTSPAPQLAQGALPDSARGALNSKQVPALLRGVGIDQRLNQQVPLDLPFRDEFGKTVRLGDFFGKRPVVLSLVYFNCPMLCTMVENNLLQSLRLLKYNVGQQYDVLTVSFDPNDTPLMAANKRRIYVGLYGRKGAAEGWHFLTGDASSIKALTDAVGFHYNYIPQTNQYAHAVGIIVLTPQGKISRYFYGVEYPAGDLRLAIDQASNGKIGSYVDALILYCCEYDANTGKYDLIVNRVLMLGGIVTVLCIGGLILVMSRGGRHHGHGAAA